MSSLDSFQRLGFANLCKGLFLCFLLVMGGGVVGCIPSQPTPADGATPEGERPPLTPEERTPESTELTPESTELTPEPTELTPEPTEPTPEQISEPTEPVIERSEWVADGAEATPEPTEVTPESAEITPESTEPVLDGSIPPDGSMPPPWTLSPQVVSSSQSAKSAKPGEKVTFRIEALAPQGGALQFAWRNNQGSITNNITNTGTGPFASQLVWPMSTQGNLVQVTITGPSGPPTVYSFSVQAASLPEAFAGGGGGGSSEQTLGRDVAVDPNGNSYVVGDFSQQATFGSTTLQETSDSSTPPSHRTVFVAKMDATGTWLWATKAGGVLNATASGVVLDGNGSIYITGGFSGSATFGATTLTSVGDEDIFIAKLDSAGNWLWAKQAGGSAADRGYSIATDGNHQVYVYGLFGTNSPNATATFGNVTFSSPARGFVAKLSDSGAWLWVKQAAGTFFSTLSGKPGDLYVTASGDVYLTTSFSGTFTMGSTTVNATGRGILVAKMDAQGNWLWVKQTVGMGGSSGTGITVDAQGDAYLVGNFTQSVSFGSTTLTASSMSDYFVAKIDGSGQWQWAIQSGNAVLSVLGLNVAVDANGMLFITGMTQGPLTFGTHTLSSTSSTSVFVAEMDPSGKWICAIQTGGQGAYGSATIDVNVHGDFRITGSFRGNTTFGQTQLSANTATEAFVWHYTAGRCPTQVVSATSDHASTGKAVATDNLGNKWVVGTYTTSISFGNHQLIAPPMPAFPTLPHLFIAKMDANRHWLWASQANSPAGILPFSLAVDSQGHAYVTGIFYNQASFGTQGLQSSGNRAFLAKIDGSGNWLWVRLIDNGGVGRPPRVQVDASDQVVISGAYLGTIVLGSTQLTNTASQPNSQYNMFVAKLDGLGNWLWATKAGGHNVTLSGGVAYPTGLDIDANGTIYTTGSYVGPVRFGTHDFSQVGGTHCFVGALSSSGTWQWVKGASGCSDGSVTVDQSGGVLITGVFYTQTAFGGFSLQTSHTAAMFVAKMDASQNWLWAVKADGPSSGTGSAAAPTSIHATSTGEISITGTLVGTTSFGSFNLSSALRDAFVVRMSATGSWVSAEKAGGTKDDLGEDGALEPQGSAVVTGTFRDTASFGSAQLSAPLNATRFFVWFP
ncbi:MAG: hypothetical protein H6727_03295 [Myxococcales bacterium]|nr:hypothetical protein [Myxococcales bacterium]